MSINILLGDDHPAILNGLKSYLVEKPNLNVVGACCNGVEVLEKYGECKPDVTILDISMPVLDGYEAAKRILQKNKNAKILFFSVSLCRAEIYQAYKLGAKGFVSKENELTIFEEAINSIYHNELYFDDCFTEKHFLEYDQVFKTTKKRPELLTKREKDVLPLVAQGFTNSQIADKLFLSVKTIEFHKKNLRRKLGLIGSAEFMKFALEFNR